MSYYHKARASDAPLWAWILAFLVGVPAVALLAVVLYAALALVGAPATLFVWNVGLTEFLSATGLGTVSTLGFWGAFKVNLLALWVNFTVRAVGRGFETKKSSD